MILALILAQLSYQGIVAYGYNFTPNPNGGFGESARPTVYSGTFSKQTGMLAGRVLAVSPYNAVLGGNLVVDDDGNVSMLRDSGADKLCRIPAGPLNQYTELDSIADIRCAVNSAGTKFAVSGDNGYGCRIFDLPSGKLIRQKTLAEISRTYRNADDSGAMDPGVVFSPDGNFVACSFPGKEYAGTGGDKDPQIIKININTGSTSFVNAGAPIAWTRDGLWWHLAGKIGLGKKVVNHDLSPAATSVVDDKLIVYCCLGDLPYQFHILTRAGKIEKSMSLPNWMTRIEVNYAYLQPATP